MEHKQTYEVDLVDLETQTTGKAPEPSVQGTDANREGGAYPLNHEQENSLYLNQVQRENPRQNQSCRSRKLKQVSSSAGRLISRRKWDEWSDHTRFQTGDMKVYIPYTTECAVKKQEDSDLLPT